MAHKQHTIDSLLEKIEKQQKQLEYYQSIELRSQSLVFGDVYVQNKKLKEEIQQLKNKINYLTAHTHDELYVTGSERLEITEHIQMISEPDNTYRYTPTADWRFVTLTFDPARFGVDNDPAHEALYILKVLTNGIKEEYIFQLYGCFERQRSGVVHSHCLIKTGDEIKLLRYLKRNFTNNPRNNKAVDAPPAKHPQALEYINKTCPYGFEKSWFKLNNLPSKFESIFYDLDA